MWILPLLSCAVPAEDAILDLTVNLALPASGYQIVTPP